MTDCCEVECSVLTTINEDVMLCYMLQVSSSFCRVSKAIRRSTYEQFRSTFHRKRSVLVISLLQAAIYERYSAKFHEASTAPVSRLPQNNGNVFSRVRCSACGSKSSSGSY